VANNEKWWLLRVKVQAVTPRKAMETLRRVSAMPESFEDINDLGKVTMEGVAETESPWRPAETAQKTGEDFIGYDDNIEHAEVMRWQTLSLCRLPPGTIDLGAARVLLCRSHCGERIVRPAHKNTV
jgi:hypothetical protein